MKPCLLLEIISITKFLLLEIKYVINECCLFDYWQILLLYTSMICEWTYKFMAE